MPIMAQRISDVGQGGPAQSLTTVKWTSPLGRVTHLSDWPTGYLVQPGARGLDMPTFKAYETESPQIHGNRRTGTKANAREIMIPVVIYSHDGRAAFLERKRQLLKDLSPLDGDGGRGTLTLTEPDGSSRSITAIYASGAEGSEDLDAAGRRWTAYGLTWTCESPFWEGKPFGRSFRAGVVENFFPSGVPWEVADSQVLGADVRIFNPGDVQAFPVWTLRGPMESATFTHPAAGTWTLTRTLALGDVAVIDTRERIKTALLNDAVDLWPNIDEAAVLWPLLSGENRVDLVVTGSTPDTVVEFEVTPRYLSA
ncbi:phage tail domain-containing protein [Actinomadura sp. WMMA1423]|uniref:phage tail domain-containing protein n=1 Tax=Actinomadura sp. WMMA1423 TaxID=2591108 RepID=UPI001147010F|nr:phage tail domain-containing protein [Actinomadura sp. WMMA1423]